MQRWEYLSVASALSQADLNKLGLQGWELVSLNLEPGANNKPSFFAWIFKRPLGEAHR